MWKQYVPWIKPFYAVKSNNDSRLMSWMIDDFGKTMGFDCASITEMDTVRKISRSSPILYAQPCKTLEDINQSTRYGIRTTVVDSPEEMIKMGRANWKGDVFIRLLVPDENSRQPFSKKFGAPVQWVPSILDIAKQYKIPVSGLSFHVGSECENPQQFSRALQVCRSAMDLAAEASVKMDHIDIGGGFLPNEASFSNIASCLESARAKYFPNNISPTGRPIKWYAEPGRFLSGPTQCLYTPIIGRKSGLPSEDPEAPEFRYTLHESVYGFFSNVPFDGQKPEFKIVHKTKKNLVDREFRSILFGRTCDGADIINPSIKLPLLDMGDWFEVDNMGAYTNVTASEFNGFPKPDTIYVE